MARATFSPTTEPMLAPMKLKSATATRSGAPSMVPVPQMIASFRPVFVWVSTS